MLNLSQESEDRSYERLQKWAALAGYGVVLYLIVRHFVFFFLFHIL